MSKKIKPNRYRPEAGEQESVHSDFVSTIDFFLKCIMTIAFISILSIASIFAYDFITQNNFFNIKKEKISGTQRVLEKEILKLADLNSNENIFKINLYKIEKRIESHPWIQSAKVKRDLPSILSISITEHKPLAIMNIGGKASVLINTQGDPFKEYNHDKDNLGKLPVVKGVDLTHLKDQYMFNGSLFDSIINFLATKNSCNAMIIKGDKNTGITIEVKDIYNHLPSYEQGIIQIKLGFNNFRAKLNKAVKISKYIDKHFPERTICSMDLFNIEKVFIKTTLNNALHNNLKKGA